MEKLQSQFLSLYNKDTTPKPLRKRLQTGVVYHEDMLLHRTSPDPETCKNHVENPHRLSSIISLLTSKKTLTNCETITQITEIPWQKIQNIHGLEYTNYLQKLWPENYNYYKKTFISTYYNKHTTRAARLAANATVLASEKVYLGEWQNAFSLVRPPGHHANAGETIGGFCFVNNVAVAAQELVGRFGVKRIVVLDWDVHHGDSTQKLFYERDDVLYVSIHKFCYGKFYPGKKGNREFLGEGKGSGFNLNFPINPVKNQFVGDQEYIFAFERMILPVLKEFDPEFVFVSSGFDCLYGDPLGQFNVTQDSLMYMLYRIKNCVTSKINVVLEGGYNLVKISEAADGILKVLKGDYVPNLSNKIGINLYHLKWNIRPLSLFVQNLKENLVFWEKNWKDCLNTPELLKYEKTILYSINLGENFAGGHYKTMYLENGKFYKGLKNTEIKFYKETYEKLPLLHKLMPKTEGFLEKDGKTYLIMEDLLLGGNYNIMDIKLTAFYNPKYHLSKFFRKYKSNLGGYSIKNIEGKIIEKRRGYFNRIDKEDFLLTIERFFKNYRGRVNYKKIEEILFFIDKIIEIYYPNDYYLSQCSLFILFDPKTEEFKIKLIDYAYFKILKNQNVMACLRGLREVLDELVKENKLDF